MNLSAGPPIILYHYCLPQPFIRGFAQLRAGKRSYKKRLPEGEEGAAGQVQKLLAAFPTQEVQGDCSPDCRDARGSIVLRMDGAVISKRHKKERKGKGKAGGPEK